MTADETSINALIRLMASIQWDKPGLASDFIEPEETHPFRPLYESLSLIKNDFDTVLAEKESAEDALKKINEELEERVRQRTHELAEINVQLEEASNAKSRFLANVSHEIRNPLQSITSYAQLIDKSHDPEVRNCARGIQTETELLLAIIEQILDISRIEAGHIELSQVPFRLVSLIDEVVQPFELLANRKGLSLIVSRDPDVPSSVEGDRTKLRQVLNNLLGNAIKFTERGAVTFRVILMTESASQVLIRFEVEDTGLGIPEDKINRIFQPFEQADDTIMQRYGGTGLGVSISSSLIRAMGGELEVESEYGEGSLFSFALPFRLPGGQEGEAIETEPKALPLAGLRGLVVEDYEANCELFRTHLVRAGAQVSVSGDGKEALQVFQDEPLFDFILMDVRMPVMDGLMATRAIRETEKGKTLFIAGLTAHAFREEESLCLESGMDIVLTKPVDWNEVIPLLLARIQAKKKTVPC